MTDKLATLLRIHKVTGNSTMALTKRQISRVIPLLEDLLEAYAAEFPRDTGGFEFQELVNVDLLNLGMSDLFLVANDFDLNVIDKSLRVTGVWVWSPGRQQIVVDILFGAPE